MGIDRLQFAKRHSNILGAMHHCGYRSGALTRFFVLLGTILALTLPSVVLGQKAQHLDGTPADPFALSAGKPVVLLFLRTDCPISNRYAPVIKKMSAQYQGKVAFWLVYPNRKIDAEKIREYQHEYGYDLPPLRDPQHALVAQAQAQVTPEAAVFDGSGRLLYHGRIDDLYQDFGRPRTVATTHELDDAIQAALNGKKPPANAPAVGCYIADME
jgi:thiol-disulfide isomerase/thioredoxin